MKKQLFSGLTALALAASLAAPALALDPVSFEGGALSGLFQKEDGTLLVADAYNKIVWKVNGEEVAIEAGQIPPGDVNGDPVGGLYEDATLATALFASPWAIAHFIDGYAVSDPDNHVVRIILEDRNCVETLTGTGEVGYLDAYSVISAFNTPTGLAEKNDGKLFIADTGNNAIRILDKQGYMSTVVSGLESPTGLCWKNGALYVCETGRSRIVRVDGAQVTVIAGGNEVMEDGGWSTGYTDGPVAEARFAHPQGIAVADDGTTYVADTDNHAIRKISTDGMVTSVLVSRSSPAAPAAPRGLLLTDDNTLLVADTYAQTLLSIDLSAVHYGDVEAGSRYEKAIYTATERGIVNGVSEGRFAPDEGLTRAQFITMLSRLEQSLDGNAVIAGSSVFSDIPADYWCAGPVAWGADNGIILGTDGAFRPRDPLTHQQLCTILCRYAADHGLSTEAAVAMAGYGDWDQVSDYAVEGMRWAAANSLWNGSNGMLLPTQNATRAEAVSMLVGVLGLLEG